MKTKIRNWMLLAAVLLVPGAWAHGGHDHIMGTLKAIDAKTITVETQDKKELKILVDANTKFEKSGAASSLKGLSVGDRVVVHAQRNGNDLTAVVVKSGAIESGHGGPADVHGHTDASVPAALPPPRTLALSVTEGGFVPPNVEIKMGVAVNLVITRTTDQTCAKDIKIPEYGVKQALPLNTPVTITLTPKKTGQIKYSCGMGMISGVLTID